MAPAGCHTHRHASRDSYYKNMINLIHHIYHSSHPFWPYHITRHMLQKQVRRPLIVVANFYVAAIGFLARLRVLRLLMSEDTWMGFRMLRLLGPCDAPDLIIH